MLYEVITREIVDARGLGPYDYRSRSVAAGFGCAFGALVDSPSISLRNNFV